jgi:integrase/recombinase XerC
MGEISLKQGIEDYKEIYLRYRNFADRTRVEYVNDLLDLARFLEGLRVDTVGKVTLPHLMRYVAELEKRGFAGSTRKRKVISIRSFFGFLHSEGHIQTDIGKRLIVPFVGAKKPRYLTKEEYTRLLDCAKSNKRDYAIIQLFLHTGIKLSELVGLTINDLRVSESTDNKENQIEYIRVSGKHGIGRVIPMQPDARKAIRNYLVHRDYSTSDSLFLNRSGKPLGGRGVEKIVEKYLSIAGIKNATVNSMWHTFITLHIANGSNPKTIREVLGLKDLRSNDVYFAESQEIAKG